MRSSYSLQVLSSSFRNSVVTKFTVTPVWLWLLNMMVVSFFTMFFFAALADYVSNPDVSVEYVVIGNAVQSVAVTTVYSVATVPGIQKHVGTLSSVASTPASLFTVFLGMGIINIIGGFAAAAVSMTYASLLFGVSFASGNILSVASVMVLACLSLTGVGMMIGSIGLYLRTSEIIASVVAYIGLLLCGVNFPVSYLPEWLQVLAYCNPMTYAVEATRGAVAGAALADLWEPLAAMMSLGVLFFVVSWFAFRLFERLAARRGTMESF